MISIRRLSAVLATLWFASCAPQTVYDWGDYSQSMYSYYQDDTQAEQYVAALQKVISANETTGKRVPPGIYAEYGYMLMSTGRTADAVAFFEKEKRHWPESRQFMDVMIQYAANGGKRQEPVKTAPADGVAPTTSLGAGA